MTEKQPAPLYYAAWWRRFGAFWIDGFLFIPFTILHIKLGRTSPHLQAAAMVPTGIIMWFYWVYCHGRWGCTVGKFLTGIKVTTVEGRPISWRQAFLRSLVDIVLGVIGWIALIPAYLSIPLEGYTDLASRDRIALIMRSWPVWYPLYMKIQKGWMWSEFIVILLNKKRRALHDFIAGTVVVQKRPSFRQQKQNDPYNTDFAKEMKMDRF